MEDVTRRTFISSAAAALGMLGLAACGNGAATEEPAAEEQPGMFGGTNLVAHSETGAMQIQYYDWQVK